MVGSASGRPRGHRRRQVAARRPKQNPVGRVLDRRGSVLGTTKEKFIRAMSNTSAFHLNVLLSARSQTLEPINFWAREKGPALSAGPRWGRHVHGRLGSWVERFPAPRARPQIAYVGLVPWFDRSRTMTGSFGPTRLLQVPNARSLTRARTTQGHLSHFSGHNYLVNKQNCKAPPTFWRRPLGCWGWLGYSLSSSPAAARRSVPKEPKKPKPPHSQTVSFSLPASCRSTAWAPGQAAGPH